MTITSERTEVGERDEHPLAEALAVERDLLQHADELRAVAKRLWPDRDDAHAALNSSWCSSSFARPRPTRSWWTVAEIVTCPGRAPIHGPDARRAKPLGGRRRNRRLSVLADTQPRPARPRMAPRRPRSNTAQPRTTKGTAC